MPKFFQSFNCSKYFTSLFDLQITYEFSNFWICIYMHNPNTLLPCIKHASLKLFNRIQIDHAAELFEAGYSSEDL